MKITLRTEDPRDRVAIKELLRLSDDILHGRRDKIEQALEEAEDEATMEFFANAGVGDYCRARCSAPAIYIGLHYCLFISAMDNDVCWDIAQPPRGGEDKFPVPDFETVRLAARCAHLLPNQTEFWTMLTSEFTSRRDADAASTP